MTDNTDSLYSLLYVSAARPDLTAKDIADIQKRARAKNARLGITGLLLYSQGVFMQVLEGRQEDVKALFAAIEADPRHEPLVILGEAPIKARYFGAWAMEYQLLSAAEADTVTRAARLAPWPDLLAGDIPPRHPAQMMQALGTVFLPR